jgi:hypothetical protein
MTMCRLERVRMDVKLGLLTRLNAVAIAIALSLVGCDDDITAYNYYDGAPAPVAPKDGGGDAATDAASSDGASSDGPVGEPADAGADAPRESAVEEAATGEDAALDATATLADAGDAAGE